LSAGSQFNIKLANRQTENTLLTESVKGFKQLKKGAILMPNWEKSWQKRWKWVALVLMMGMVGVGFQTSAFASQNSKAKSVEVKEETSNSDWIWGVVLVGLLVWLLRDDGSRYRAEGKRNKLSMLGNTLRSPGRLQKLAIKPRKLPNVNGK
jgi:hypothetical protein